MKTQLPSRYRGTIHSGLKWAAPWLLMLAGIGTVVFVELYQYTDIFK